MLYLIFLGCRCDSETLNKIRSIAPAATADISALGIAKLREICVSKGLSTIGNKEELVARLSEPAVAVVAADDSTIATDQASILKSVMDHATSKSAGGVAAAAGRGSGGKVRGGAEDAAPEAASPAKVRR
jgi:hypothetical protein